MVGYSFDEILEVSGIGANTEMSKGPPWSIGAST